MIEQPSKATSARRLTCCRLPIAHPSLVRYGKALGISDSAAAALALARSVAASPAWASASSSVVMVRQEPKPILAVMGRYDDAQQAWLEAQARFLGRSCGRLRRVDYRRAETECERLAARLTERFGQDELRGMRFAAIPRGGCVVLGLLAIALGLDRRCLEPPHPPELPLVVVDDCALSGQRFRDFLECHEGHERVVFAHLFSHPDLRAAVEAREPRVLACLSARDLGATDDSPWSPDQRARFLAKMDRAYWVGAIDVLAFDWGEPDRLVWHPVEERPVPAWRIVPPELCLKNRGQRPIAVQVQPQAQGPLGPGAEVIFGELEGRIVLHHLGRGESAALDAVASGLWKAIVRRGSLPEVAAELGHEYRVSETTLLRDLSAFAEQLMEQGFLERQPPPAAAGRRGE